MEDKQQRDEGQRRMDEDRRESKLCDELQDFDGLDEGENQTEESEKAEVRANRKLPIMFHNETRY